MIRIIAFTIASVLSASSIAQEQGWGSLSGRFTYAGDPPTVELVRVTRDRTAIGDSVPDESLIVNKNNRGVSNIVVYLLPDGEELRVHPSYAATANDKVKLSMEKGRFSPHVLLLRTSQTMIQHNQGSVVYNANIQFINNSPM